MGFEPATVLARAFTAPLADPLGFGEWTGDATPKDAVTTLATIDWDGRMGLYDFTDNQWWNPLRHRRIVIRGAGGETADDRLVRLADPTTPVASAFEYRRTGIDLKLEGNDLQHISLDGRWARGEGAEPYPLADGLQDHLISVAIGESLATGRDVTTTTEAWAAAAGR